MKPSTPLTNRQLAERFGVSTRTIRRATSGRRSRDWWTELRREMQRYAAQLRATGMKWAEVGAALGVSEDAARALGRRGAGKWASSSQEQPGTDPNAPDLFAGPKP